MRKTRNDEASPSAPPGFTVTSSFVAASRPAARKLCTSRDATTAGSASRKVRSSASRRRLVAASGEAASCASTSFKRSAGFCVGRGVEPGVVVVETVGLALEVVLRVEVGSPTRRRAASGRLKHHSRHSRRRAETGGRVWCGSWEGLGRQSDNETVGQ